jgi:membrane protease YdiL (CAAX protease family)
VVSALAAGGDVLQALRPQIVPGILGGMAGAAIIVAFHRFAPEALTAAQPATPLPLVVRVLYGGITEEVLVRWGLLTIIAWAGWRIAGRPSEHPSVPIMWAAIAISALLFGLSHLPAALAVVRDLSASVAVYVTLGNAGFGMVAGYLFWRHGLEAAIMAHGLAHLLAFMVLG